MTDAVLAWLEEGQSALEAGHFDVAAAAFARVQQQLPTDVSVAIALANVYRLGGDAPRARHTLLEAHAGGVWADPSVAFALGAALLDAGAAREAADCFEHVVSLMPRNPAALGALAGARRTLGDPESAWPLIHHAVSKATRDPALLLTASQIRHDLADIAGALRWLDRADAVRPNHRATQVQRAYSVLIRGASREGWAAFEHRPLPTPDTGARPWHGEPFDGSSVLVTAEQGVGDQFQFVRFVEHLVTRGAGRVLVECHIDCVSLLTANGFDAVARGAPPVTDFHVPMLSLPHRLGLDDAVDGGRVPYLRPSRTPPVIPRRAGARRFGLVWAGNPSFTGRLTRDFDSSRLQEIVDIPEIEWTSLQHGHAGDVSVHGLGREALTTSWLSTADRLASLDGLVTTDTGIAHLAGAMGVPTWVLLQRVPDWRWGLEGETTPWYPSVRLVRQSKSGDWAGVVDALRQMLLVVRA